MSTFAINQYSNVVVKDMAINAKHLDRKHPRVCVQA